MSIEEQEQRLRQIQRQYVGFFDDGEAEGKYQRVVGDLIKDKKNRLLVNINDLRRALPDRTKNLIEDAFDEVLAMQRALKEYVGSIDPSYAKETTDFFVGFEGAFGSRHVTARTLTSRHINNLVCVEGIVTKVSLVRPKVVKSVHYCPTTTKNLERNYSDLTSLEAYPTSAAYPTQDDDGNPLQTEYGLSTYKDHQTLTIQELPEKAPTGQLPRSVDVILEHDLVDQTKPGDRVQIIASLRALPGKQGGYTTGTFRTILLANNIVQLKQQEEDTISGDDVAKCRKLAKSEKKRIFNILARSLAPSIHGHEYVKKALLCQLLGGLEKVLPNGTRLRGDINIMLIGDPSVAKSQMLRYVLATSNRAVATTGRGTSGVGLTAAVTTDQETGERRLEAGAMVLADRGIVCIDEFDKMTDQDRTAIHEVMEQGRVTISKAGIHARLNARSSVLAAANPVYGRYDAFKTPMQNIGMQDSLLSRFDLVFILLDTVDLESDRMISDHVVRVHRYRSPREVDGEVTLINSGADELSTAAKEASEVKETPMWEKHDNLLHGGQRAKRGSERLLHLDFVKKYIEVAKCLKPVLTEEACEMIGEEYSRLRSQDFESGADNNARTQPVTARALETLIRLATAHAKARLSKSIEKEDAETAIQLVQFAYFKKVEKKRKRKANDGDDSDSEGEDEESQEESTESTETSHATPREDSQESITDTDDIISRPKEAKRPRTQEEPSTQSQAAESVEISDAQLNNFKKELFALFEAKHQQQLPMEDVKAAILGKKEFNEAQMMACITKMTDDNKIMLASDVLYMI